MLGATSVPRQALLEAARGSDICASAATFNEFELVSRRQKFNAYLPLADRLQFLELYRAQATIWIVDPLSEARAHGVCRDAKDTMFLALALECQAQVLITSDADLLVLHGWEGIAIMKPAAFIEALQRSA